MSDESKIRDAAEAVKGIAEAVPVYQDMLQPAAKEIGTALQTVAKTIHIALAPISALVWGFEQIKEFVLTKVAEKLKDVPPENIVTPKPNVACPALESLRYTGYEETLREMYANLLAASMDTRTANRAHPSFVEVIRQLTPDEARILLLLTQLRQIPVISIRRNFKVQTETESGGVDILVNFSLLGWQAGCDFPDQTPTYLDNFCRLGLTTIPDSFYTMPGSYDQIEKHPFVESIKKSIEVDEKYIAVITRMILLVTEFGKKFLNVCVVSHDQKGLPKKNT